MTCSIKKFIIQNQGFIYKLNVLLQPLKNNKTDSSAHKHENYIQLYSSYTDKMVMFSILNDWLSNLNELLLIKWF